MLLRLSLSNGDNAYINLDHVVSVEADPTSPSDAPRAVVGLVAGGPCVVAGSADEIAQALNGAALTVPSFSSTFNPGCQR